MITLLLAASFFTITQPNPYIPGGYTSVTTEDESKSMPILSQTDQIVDKQFASNPNLQQDAYSFQALQDKYPVNSVLPPSQVQTMPLENQIALQQAQVKMQSDRLAVQQQAFRNQADQTNFTYQQNTLDQASGALKNLGTLDPASENYMQQRTEFVKQYPLGVQNVAVARNLAALDANHNLLAQNQAASIRMQDQSYNRELAQARSFLANDPEGLSQFESNLGSTPMASPIHVASAIRLQRQQENLEGQLKGYGYDPNQYRVDPADPDSPLDPVTAGFAIHTASEKQKIKDDVEKRRLMGENTIEQRAEYDEGRASRPLTYAQAQNTAQEIRILSDRKAAGKITAQEQALLDFNMKAFQDYQESRNRVTAVPTIASTPSSVSQFKEGQTATNKKTGQKMIYQGGNWVPAQ